MPRRLGSAEQWLLWREAVREACKGLDVLMPDELVAPVREAARLLDDHGINLGSAANAEVGVLLQARAHFRARCELLGALGGASWRDYAYLRPSPSLMLAGFAQLGPALKAWLEGYGTRFAMSEPGPAPTPAQVLGCESAEAEAQAAAHWCALELECDPLRRMLVVVPQLSQQRHVWQRAFAQRLDADVILNGDAAGRSRFAIEGGVSLASYPLVESALQLIALAFSSASFEQLSALLRSPYLGLIERTSGQRIDCWMRDQNLRLTRAEALAPLLGVIERELDVGAAGMLARLIAILIDAAGRPAAADSGASASLWAQRFADLLARARWPGLQALDSLEQQVRMRFDELLGEFAGIAVPIERLGPRKPASCCTAWRSESASSRPVTMCRSR